MPVSRDRWSKEFGEWFRNVLLNAEIMDYRYPIKGCGVWLPYGFKLRKNVLKILRELLDSTGHEEVQFPLLIPETSLAKESRHVRSFEDECFWVTHGGSTPLKVRYALRPTSETAINPMLKLWIRSHRDLPVAIYQIVNVFRYETKATRPLIRMREVTTFKEAHTAHATAEEAEKQVEKAVSVYKRFFDSIGVPYLISKRPEWDKFAGAEYSIAFDMICPDGRVLQIGTVHNLGQNFSKAFDVTYETVDGGREYVYQTCYGISERAIASIVIAHGDDNGLVLPYDVAPIQVVVIPIPYKGKEEPINEAVRDVVRKLEAAGIRVELDDREDLTPGSKFYYWELRGVPIRVEVGPRDVERGEVTVVRRDTLERSGCKLDAVVEKVVETAKQMTADLSKRAWEWMRKHIHYVDSLEEAEKLIKEREGVIQLFWCGSEDCGREIEERVDARVLGVPMDESLEREGSCVVCGRRTRYLVRVAAAY
ncbi:proline--tRNA ligase [Candidatus Bathyarchaeota archaeon]|nr:MAG: proline--tRNA ligase [Candidatus Bathyarchaeota archaeon]